MPDIPYEIKVYPNQASVDATRKAIESQLTNLSFGFSSRAFKDASSSISQNVIPKISFEVNKSSITSLARQIREGLGPVSINLTASEASLEKIRSQVANKIKVDVEISDSKTSFQSLGKITNEVAAQFDKMSKAKDRFAANVAEKFPQIINHVKALNEQLAIAQGNFGIRVTGATSVAKRPRTDLDNRIDAGLSEGDRNFAKEAEQANKALQSQQKELDKTKAKLNQYEQASERAKAKTLTFAEAVGNTTKRLAAYFIPAVAFFQFIRGISVAKDQIVEIDKGLNQLVQVFHGNADEANRLADSVFNSAAKLGQSATDTLTIAKTLSQVGGVFGTTADQLAPVVDLLSKTKLAVSFGDVQETTEGAISYINQFKLSLSDLNEVFDVTNEVSKQFGVEARDIFKAVQIGGATFSELGGNYKQFIAVVTALREITRLPVQQVGTGIGSITQYLVQPKALDAIQQLGGNIYDTNGQLKDFIGLMQEAGKATKDLDVPAKAGFVKTVFGVRNTKVALPLLQDLQRGDDSVAAKALAVANNSLGSLNRDASIGLQQIQVILGQVGAEYQKVFLDLARNDSFKDFIKEIATGLTIIAKTLQSISGIFPTLLRIGGAALFAATVRSLPSVARGFTQARGNEGGGGGLLSFFTGGGGPRSPTETQAEIVTKEQTSATVVNTQSHQTNTQAVVALTSAMAGVSAVSAARNISLPILSSGGAITGTTNGLNILNQGFTPTKETTETILRNRLRVLNANVPSLEAQTGIGNFGASQRFGQKGLDIRSAFPSLLPRPYGAYSTAINRDVQPQSESNLTTSAGISSLLSGIPYGGVTIDKKAARNLKYLESMGVIAAPGSPLQYGFNPLGSVSAPPSVSGPSPEQYGVRRFPYTVSPSSAQFIHEIGPQTYGLRSSFPLSVLNPNAPSSSPVFFNTMRNTASMQAIGDLQEQQRIHRERMAGRYQGGLGGSFGMITQTNPNLPIQGPTLIGGGVSSETGIRLERFWNRLDERTSRVVEGGRNLAGSAFRGLRNPRFVSGASIALPFVMDAVGSSSLFDSNPLVDQNTGRRYNDYQQRISGNMFSSGGRGFLQGAAQGGTVGALSFGPVGALVGGAVGGLVGGLNSLISASKDASNQLLLLASSAKDLKSVNSTAKEAFNLQNSSLFGIGNAVSPIGGQNVGFGVLTQKLFGSGNFESFLKSGTPQADAAVQKYGQLTNNIAKSISRGNVNLTSDQFKSKFAERVSSQISDKGDQQTIIKLFSDAAEQEYKLASSQKVLNDSYNDLTNTVDSLVKSMEYAVLGLNEFNNSNKIITATQSDFLSGVSNNTNVSGIGVTRDDFREGVLSRFNNVVNTGGSKQSIAGASLGLLSPEEVGNTFVASQAKKSVQSIFDSVASAAQSDKGDEEGTKIIDEARKNILSQFGFLERSASTDTQKDIVKKFKDYANKALDAKGLKELDQQTLKQIGNELSNKFELLGKTSDILKARLEAMAIAFDQQNLAFKAGEEVTKQFQQVLQNTIAVHLTQFGRAKSIGLSEGQTSGRLGGILDSIPNANIVSASSKLIQATQNAVPYQQDINAILKSGQTSGFTEKQQEAVNSYNNLNKAQNEYSRAVENSQKKLEVLSALFQEYQNQLQKTIQTNAGLSRLSTQDLSNTRIGVAQAQGFGLFQGLNGDSTLASVLGGNKNDLTQRANQFAAIPDAIADNITRALQNMGNRVIDPTSGLRANNALEIFEQLRGAGRLGDSGENIRDLIQRQQNVQGINQQMMQIENTQLNTQQNIAENVARIAEQILNLPQGILTRNVPTVQTAGGAAINDQVSNLINTLDLHNKANQGLISTIQAFADAIAKAKEGKTEVTFQGTFDANVFGDVSKDEATAAIVAKVLEVFINQLDNSVPAQADLRNKLGLALKQIKKG